MGPDSNFFESILPPIDLGEITNRAMAMVSVKALWAGGSLLLVGFLLRLIPQLWNLIRNREADLWSPFVHLVGFGAVLAAYRPITYGIIDFITHLGVDLGGGTLVHETFARRLQALHRYNVEHRDTSIVGAITSSGVVKMMLTGVAYAMHIAVQGTAFILQTTQLLTLAVISAFGPILLGFSSLSPYFYSLGIGWFWALVEVSAWSFTMDVMLFVFDQMGRQIPKDFVYAQEIVICGVVLYGLTSVTRITAMLVRGQAAGAIGQAPLAIATGSAILAARSAIRSAARPLHSRMTPRALSQPLPEIPPAARPSAAPAAAMPSKIRHV